MTGRRRLTVDAGSFVVSNCPEDVLATAGAVGSGVVVCVSDDHAGLAALLHFASPDSKASPGEAMTQPARFADTGLALLFEEVDRQYALAGQKPPRWKVRLVGAASLPEENGSEKVAKRNLLAARSALWRRGVFLDREDVGGTRPRRATLTVQDGQLIVELEDESGDSTTEHTQES